MFVGDVRCATTGLGVSWKLSGGNAWSSGPTNVAKNRHVRRAIDRRARTSSDESGWVTAVLRGTLIHRATAGDTAHSIRKGSAAGQASGRPHATATDAAPASATPPPIRWQKPRRSRRRPAFACAAVTHSSSLRCVTYTRTSVRTIASLISQAWCVSIVIVNPICEAARTASLPTARAWLRFEMPRRRGINPLRTGKSEGTAMVARTNALHTAGDVPGTVHATTSVRKEAGADT